MADFNWPPTVFNGGVATTVRIEDSNGNAIVEGQQTMANSLPVVIASDQTPVPVLLSDTVTTPLFVELSNGVTAYNTNTAAQLPAALGQNTMANSLTVAIASNQSSVPVTFTTTAATPIAVELSNGATFYNAPTTAQFPAALGQTTEAGSLSVTIASNQSAVSVTPSNTVGTPVFVEPGNGTNSYTSAAIAASQFTQSTATAVPVNAGLAMGWDGTTHREISVTNTGVVNTTGSVTLPYDENYGTPTATTLRTASMLGMGSTAVSATNPVFVELSNGAGTYNTNTASQLPAALGQTTMAASLPVAIASNQSAIPVTVSSLPTTSDTNYGTPTASTLRTASMLGMGSTAVGVTNPVFVQPGNGTNNFSSAAIAAAQFTQATATAVPVEAGLAMGWDGTTHREISVSTTGVVNVASSNFPTTLDTNYGTPGASTLRTAAMLGMGSTAVSVTNPIFNQPGNGTNSFTSAAITAAQFTQSTATAVPVGANLAVGWDGTTHRELSVSATGGLNTALGGLAIQNFLALDTSSTNITSAAYVQLFASTTAAVSWVSIFNGSGSILELATGGSGSEVVQLVVPPGGIEARLAIAASTRVAVRRYPAVSTDMTSGFFTINLMG